MHTAIDHLMLLSISLHYIMPRTLHKDANDEGIYIYIVGHVKIVMIYYVIAIAWAV